MKKVSYSVILRERYSGMETSVLVDSRKACISRARLLASMLADYDVIVRKQVVCVDDVIFNP